jgi:Zn-dependent peptidase ImmA (M78 family)
MTEMISALLSWAVMLSVYPAPERLPQVEFKPHSFFVANACANVHCNVLGWYNDRGIVYLDERLRSDDSAFGLSVWVHEFVHYLQHQSGRYDSDNCSDQARREREAYAIQREYIIRAHGKAPFIRAKLYRC